MLWFVEGSGGESHLRMLFLNWLPEGMGEARCPALMSLDNERFT